MKFKDLTKDPSFNRFVPHSIIDDDGFKPVNSSGKNWLIDDPWTELVNYVIKLPGDFIYVKFDSGTVALYQGILE